MEWKPEGGRREGALVSRAPFPFIVLGSEVHLQLLYISGTRERQRVPAPCDRRSVGDRVHEVDAGLDLIVDLLVRRAQEIEDPVSMAQLRDQELGAEFVRQVPTSRPHSLELWQPEAHSGNTAPRRHLLTGGAFALRGIEGQLSHVRHLAQVTPPATTTIVPIDRVHR